MMRRLGLPQGLSMSPLLATMVLELINPPSGLTMYADDGLIIGEKADKEGIEKWLGDLKNRGIIIEPKKSGWIDNEFKFLGVDFNITKKRLSYRGHSITFDEADVTLEENKEIVLMWLKQVAHIMEKNRKDELEI